MTKAEPTGALRAALEEEQARKLSERNISESRRMSLKNTLEKGGW